MLFSNYLAKILCFLAKIVVVIRDGRFRISNPPNPSNFGPESGRSVGLSESENISCGDLLLRYHRLVLLAVTPCGDLIRVSLCSYR